MARKPRAWTPERQKAREQFAADREAYRAGHAVAAWTPDRASVPAPPPAPILAVEQAALAAAERGEFGGIGDENAEAFKKLLGLSLKQSIAIMEMQLDPEDKNFAKLMSTQQSIMSSVFSTTARIDDALLQRAKTDEMDQVLGVLAEEAKKLEGRGGAAPAPVVEEDENTRALRELGML
jgi:hypothetical protein